MQYGGPYMSDIDKKQQGGEGALYSKNPMFYDYKEQLYGTGPGPLHIGVKKYPDYGFIGAPNPNMYVGDVKGYKKALRKFKRDAMKQYRDVSKEPGLGREYLRSSRAALEQYLRDELGDIEYANRGIGRGKANRLMG